jgi:DNA polymerase III subunit delta'
VSTALLVEAIEHQPGARLALTAALSAGPSHAYLFHGPRGAGKRAAARAFAAEILAASATDSAAGGEEDARRRALLDPSPHPDLVWLTPSGPQHMVEDVREQVIRAATYRPFEGGKRVFVIEVAEAMRAESQNALLKTLEEPPGFVHLILISSEPAALLETISSRCQPVAFVPLPTAAVEAALVGAGATRPGSADAGVSAGATGEDEIAAAARLSAGNVDLARFLLTERGRQLRSESLGLAFAALGDTASEAAAESTTTKPPPAPWLALLGSAETAGESAESRARDALEEEKAAGIKHAARDIASEAKRVGRRRRAQVLDLGLSLSATWFRDLGAVAVGAVDVAFNRDRLGELEAQASGLDPARARRAAELIQDCRRRLDLNVSEELALEALFFRLQRLF